MFKKYIYVFIILTCLLTTITIMASACSNLENATNTIKDKVSEVIASDELHTSIDEVLLRERGCVFWITIKAGAKVDTSLHYNLTMTIKDPYVSGDHTYTINNISISPPQYNPLYPYEELPFRVSMEVPKSTIPELVGEINKTFEDKQAKATAAFKDFEDRYAYKFAQDWSSGGKFPTESYDEMQRLMKKEKELQDAMDNVKIDYNSICKKYMKITIVPIAPETTSP
jgi:hypothetical protein